MCTSPNLASSCKSILPCVGTLLELHLCKETGGKEGVYPILYVGSSRSNSDKICTYYTISVAASCESWLADRLNCLAVELYLMRRQYKRKGAIA